MILGRAARAQFERSHDPADAATAEKAFQDALRANERFWPALQNLGVPTRGSLYSSHRWRR